MSSSTLKTKPHVEYERQELAFLDMARKTAEENILLSESEAESLQLQLLETIPGEGELD